MVLLWALAGVALQAGAAEKVGVVCLHGKWGAPAQMQGMARYLEGEGFLASAPQMAWSGTRQYDQTLEDTAAEVTAAIGDLRGKGATKVVLLGQSLGAVFAAYYMGRHAVDGLIGVSPGHNPAARRYREEAAESVARAREMVLRGEGKEKDFFLDLNSGSRSKSVRTTAEIYLDYNAPDGPLAKDTLVAGLKPATPLLILANSDEVGKSNGELSRALASRHSPDAVRVLQGNHMSLIDGEAKPAVAGWLKSLWK
jgi:dienelactone hydrolase